MSCCDILQLILESADRYPDKTAYRYGGMTITYSELKDRAYKAAAYLGDGGAVLIFGHKSPDMIVFMTACLICGRPYIPCDVSVPCERARTMIALSGADTAVICEGKVHFDGVRTVYPCDIPIGYDKKYEPQNISPYAYIIFTSGSTGVPKGIRVTRENLSRFAEYAAQLDCFKNSDITGGHALLSFDLSVAEVYLSLCFGKTCVSFDSCCDRDIQTLVCTPTFLRLCLASKDFCPECYPSLKNIVCCGEVFAAKNAQKLFKRFSDISAVNAYGPAECCCFVSAVNITAEDMGETLPVGEVGNTSYPISTVNGEIFIEGSFGGYLDGSEGFDECGYYTGDMGEIRNGRIYFKHRKGGFIKYSGYRAEPAEIETVISELDGIDECFVSTVIDEAGQVCCLKAVVISDSCTDTAYIKKKAAEKLPAYMIPKVIKICDSHSGYVGKKGTL